MSLQPAFEYFLKHYEQRFSSVEIKHILKKDEIENQVQIKSDLIRKGNSPTIFHHGKKTTDVIVLTHGMSDSPFYVKAIAKRFYNKGCNVILPLLPAHGLINPSEIIKDSALDIKWKHEIDQAVEVARKLGDRISIGGFSTGGALSYNYVLRHPEKIKGGLFLFSAAIRMGEIKEFIGRTKLLADFYGQLKDANFQALGPDPYKYYDFPFSSIDELIDIIEDNKDLYSGKIKQPVFVAHSMHDTVVDIRGVQNLLKERCQIGTGFWINENVTHAELPLETTFELDKDHPKKGYTPPKANPKFYEMMENAIAFFEDTVLSNRNV